MADTTNQTPQTPQDPPNWFQTLTGQAATTTAQALVVGQQTATGIQQAGNAAEQSAAGLAVIGGVLGGAWAAVKDWIANPLRMVKLALGLSFIGIAVVIAFLPEIGAVIAVASGAPELAPAIRAAGRRPKQTVSQVEQASVQEGFRQMTVGRPQPRRIATPPNRPGAAPFTPPQPPAPPVPQPPVGPPSLLGTIPNPFKTNPAAPFPGVSVRPGTPTQPLPIPQLPGATIPSGRFRTDPGSGGGVGVLGAGAQAADAANLPVPANDPLERIIGGRLATPSPTQQKQVRRDIPGIISQWQRIADNPMLPRADREDAQARIDALRSVMQAPTQAPSRPTLPPPVFVPKGTGPNPYRAPEAMPPPNPPPSGFTQEDIPAVLAKRADIEARRPIDNPWAWYDADTDQWYDSVEDVPAVAAVLRQTPKTQPPASAPAEPPSSTFMDDNFTRVMTAILDEARREQGGRHEVQHYVPGGRGMQTPLLAPPEEAPKVTPSVQQTPPPLSVEDINARIRAIQGRTKTPSPRPLTDIEDINRRIAEAREQRRQRQIAKEIRKQLGMEE